MTDRETEAQFQERVIKQAQLYRWRIAHFRPALTEKGWRTAVSADGAGFVDLVLVRERVIFAELKSKSGKLTDAQRDWGVALLAAGAEYYTWRPSDWDTIVRVLQAHPDRVNRYGITHGNDNEVPELA